MHLALCSFPSESTCLDSRVKLSAELRLFPSKISIGFGRGGGDRPRPQIPKPYGLTALQPSTRSNCRFC